VSHKDIIKTLDSTKEYDAEQLKKLQHLKIRVEIIGDPKRLEQSRKNMLTVVHDAARKWHGSPEGLKWHSEHAKRLIANRVIRTKLCENCAKLFQ
jgi:hypothetical protein